MAACCVRKLRAPARSRNASLAQCFFRPFLRQSVAALSPRARALVTDFRWSAPCWQANAVMSLWGAEALAPCSVCEPIHLHRHSEVVNLFKNNIAASGDACCKNPDVQSNLRQYLTSARAIRERRCCSECAPPSKISPPQAAPVFRQDRRAACRN